MTCGYAVAIDPLRFDLTPAKVARVEDKANQSGGRPTLKTAETVALVLEGFRRLGTYIAAAGYAKIGERTVYDWCESDPEFSQAVAMARAEYCSRHALALEDNATEAQHVRALQTVGRREYMPITRTELTGKDGAALAPFTMNDAPAATPAQEAKS